MSSHNPQESSSSDEEESHRSHLNLPQVNLSNIRKQQTKATPRDHFVKSKKKLQAKNKTVRFPSEDSRRDTMISNESTTNNEDSDSDNDSNYIPRRSGSLSADDANLPSFKFNSNELSNQNFNEEEEESDENDVNDDDENNQNRHQYHLDNPDNEISGSSDSSDDEREADGAGNKDKSSNLHSDNNQHNLEKQPSITSSKNSKSFHSKSAPEVSRLGTRGFRRDNDRDSFGSRRESSQHSFRTGTTGTSESRAGNTFKGILRRMALADQAYSNTHAAVNANPNTVDDVDLATDTAPSHGDSFIGRVLSLSNRSGSISGGGLAPGALHRSHNSRERTIDEEEEVGGGELDREASDSIELKRLDLEDINDEARNLIGTHVPGGAEILKNHDIAKRAERKRERERQKRSSSDNNTPPTSNSSTTFTVNKENKDGDTDISGSESGYASSVNDSPHGFYQPNSEFNVDQNLANDLQDDEFMMLDEGGGYIAPPKQVHAGVLLSLLQLYQNPQDIKSTSSLNTGSSSLAEGGDYNAHEDSDDATNNLYETKNTSTVDFTKLKSGIKKGGKMVLNAPGKVGQAGYAGYKKFGPSSRTSTGDFDEKEEEDESNENLPSFQNAKPKAPKKNTSSSKVPQVSKKLRKHKKQQNQRLRITVHIADIIQRQRFIMKLCRAFMLFGAPSHRLEDYMIMTSRVLELDGQFIYFPGCMIMAFGDAATRTSEVHLVRCSQGLNLSKLSDSHVIYKSVVHDLLAVDEATAKLEELLRKKNLYNAWICVFLYGLGSASVTPFAFSGNWYDVPISFLIGLCVGYLQFFVSSMSNLYSSVFEVTSSIVVSFIARAIGSIKDGKYFCFGAIAQGSLALILPGYIILCGSLELQSKNLVAGSVRMFYAIIYSLFLGFGITLGAALYGWVDHGATDEAVCDTGHSIDDKWRILFVPLFTLCLGLINQARWRQIPAMLFVSCVGYIANYYAAKYFKNITEFTAALGAFVIGILGNIYSRFFKGMAASVMLPAIFVQVPSGIASKSTLLAGIESANQITNSSYEGSSGSDVSSLSFGATMVEVSIGISVGLFAAALFVYPFGKKKTSLFSL
ncbi:DUF1212-domain-containing protein [Hyphopichia burtonii NRRL Y-1933]|uniref:Pheromone-regulated membrane protein 10 n=1 Tax=Hyphopichia burtonii NRRL Y-1933 TaxID=984485 RepID=A0A1E4RSN5_9ASCO|nr:DUF1212-domain-containing protein [Hyphopichia burtonii NRRL Y-1933]ODV70283.1 DUF1212-domain-containing protein [Hyphopichia burtonii NRRL Y-1933]